MLYQAREYYRLYPKDRVVLKALVRTSFSDPVVQAD